MDTSAKIQQKKAQGICTDCMKAADPGYLRCKQHRRLRTAAEKRRQIERKLAQLSPEEEHKRASLKAQLSSRKMYEFGAKRVARGLCRQCGEPAVDGLGICETHRKQANDYHVQRKALGVCVRCDQPALAGKTHCAEHLADLRQKMRDYRKNRKSRGLCYRCNNPVRHGGFLCEEHRRKVTENERSPGTVPRETHSCAICGVRSGLSLYCDEHREEGKRREKEARTIVSKVHETCSACGIYGHNVKHCRKFSPRIGNPDYEYTGNSRVLSKEAQAGDIFVLITEEYGKLHLPHASCEGVLTVRHGGRVRVLDNPAFVEPIGASGTFLMIADYRWRCENRDVSPARPSISGLPAFFTPADLQRSVEDVFFLASTRLWNVFRNIEIKTLEDLYRYGRAKLMQTINFGRTCMWEIDQTLAAAGLPELP